MNDSNAGQSNDVYGLDYEFKVIHGAPPFTIADLRRAIPENCWKRSNTSSIYYFLKDVLIIFVIYYLVYYFYEYFQKFLVLYPLFWYAQGTMFWCLFVVGHDCGHGSFSESSTINNLFGHLSHTPILVPFHPWRLSHKTHHANTANIRKDESFVAVSERHYRIMFRFIKFVRYYMYPIGGWTLYLIFGMPIHYRSHIIPFSSLFKTPEDKRCALESLVWFWAFVGLLGYLHRQYGFWFMFLHYWAPYLVFGAWIAIVTHMHHTHPDVPWYRDGEWEYLKGALSTVDRNYGLIENLHHDIGTHIVHHLFTKIPHYHLKEATEHIKPILGSFYRRSNESMFQAMWRVFKYCRWVPNEGTRVFFQSNLTSKVK